MLVSVHLPSTALLRSSKHLRDLHPPVARRFRNAGVVNFKPNDRQEQQQQQQQQQELQQRTASGTPHPVPPVRAQRQGGDVSLPRPPSLQRFNETLFQVQREMDHVLNEFFGEDTSPTALLMPFALDRGLGLASRPGAAVQPDSAYGSAAVRVDVEESEKDYLISAEIPGFSKDHVKVELSPDGVLSIKGDLKEADEGTRRKSLRISSFARSFRLPNDVDVAGISAKVDHGILQVVVPKVVKEEVHVKEIPIQ